MKNEDNFYIVKFGDVCDVIELTPDEFAILMITPSKFELIEQAHLIFRGKNLTLQYKNYVKHVKNN
jgi:hypothetical protein